MASESETYTNSVPLAEDKRRPKCPGCKLPHDVHILSAPGPYCTGPTSSSVSPSKDTAAAKQSPSVIDDAESEDEDHEEELLVARLRELQLQEAALRKQRRTQQLRDSIAETESRLAALGKVRFSWGGGRAGEFWYFFPKKCWPSLPF